MFWLLCYHGDLKQEYNKSAFLNSVKKEEEKSEKEEKKEEQINLILNISVVSSSSAEKKTRVLYQQTKFLTQKIETTPFL